MHGRCLEEAVRRAGEERDPLPPTGHASARRDVVAHPRGVRWVRRPVDGRFEPAFEAGARPRRIDLLPVARTASAGSSSYSASAGGSANGQSHTQEEGKADV